MFAKDSNRGHVHERMKTAFSNSSRIAGTGITYDNYDEESFPIGAKPRAYEGTPIYKTLTQEELHFRTYGGPIKTYRIGELEKGGAE